MVICLDTSGSMKGDPENVAKALVLQCLKVAFAEKRKCYVYLFGSKNEVNELELSLEPSGFDYLLNFLCMSFGGGTDIHDPLNMALEKCDTDDWKKADILVVSDGEFHVSSGLSRKVTNRKQKTGLRVHGVLIGDTSSAMESICYPVHKFSEWIELRNSQI
nr:VWA domain-containing protein [Vibrio fluvialis]